MGRSLIGALTLLAAVIAPRGACAAECQARCEGPGGAVAVVSAGTCTDAEECRAGCDDGPAGRGRPYAACVSRATGEIAPRRAVVPTDARRE